MKNLSAEFLYNAIVATKDQFLLEELEKFWRLNGRCDLRTVIQHSDYESLASGIMYRFNKGHWMSLRTEAYASGATFNYEQAYKNALAARTAAIKQAYADHADKTEYLEGNAEYWKACADAEDDYNQRLGLADIVYDEERRAILLAHITEE